jgi:hypothetical protein
MKRCLFLIWLLVLAGIASAQTNGFVREAVSNIMARSSVRITNFAPHPQIRFTNWTPKISTFLIGSNLQTTFVYPPDNGIAAGPTNLVSVTNDRIVGFDKQGNSVGFNSDINNFFASIRSDRVTDPNVIYDKITQKWYVSAIDVANPNILLLAKSDGWWINAGTVWTFHGIGAGGGLGTFIDEPRMAIDRFGLLIGVNTGIGGYVILVDFNLSLQNAIATGPSPRPVENDDLDTNALVGYVTVGDAVHMTVLNITNRNNPGIEHSVSLMVPYAPTPPNPQPQPLVRHISGFPDTPFPTPGLDPGDNRLCFSRMHKSTAVGDVYQKNVGSIWTAHPISVNQQGTGDSFNLGLRGAIRWYEIGVSGKGFSNGQFAWIRQSGTIFDPATNNPYGFMYPAVSPTGQGAAVFGWNISRTNVIPGIMATGRLFDSAPGRPNNLSEGQTITTNGPIYQTFQPVGSEWNGLYAPLNNLGEPTNEVQRYGDYSWSCCDPNDDQTVWLQSEFADNISAWATQVMKLLAPPPPQNLNGSFSLESPSPSNYVFASSSDTDTTHRFFGGTPGYSNKWTMTITPCGGCPSAYITNTMGFFAPTGQSLVNAWIFDNRVVGTVVFSSPPVGFTNYSFVMKNPDGQTASGTFLTPPP